MIRKGILLNKEAKLVVEKLIKLRKQGKIRGIDELGHVEGRIEFKKIRNYFKQKKVDQVVWKKDIRLRHCTLRHYRGKPNSPDIILPIMLYFHGGGWVVGDLDTHDAICRKLASKAKFDVISVDYSLAPENPFPRAVEDCIETLKWLSLNHKKLKVTTEKILLCGDSAGGNLAAVLSIYNRDILKKNIIYQILIYPATVFFSNFPSKRKYDGIILSSNLMKWFENNYLSGKDPEKYKNDWRLSPANAQNLKDLPKTLIILAECDPLFDEGNYFAELLKKNYNDIENIICAGQIHGFLTMGGVIEEANIIIQQIRDKANSELGYI